MIPVSPEWKEKQKELLLPETFVEITCAITEAGVQELATATGTNEAFFSDAAEVTGTDEQTTKKYATLEPNLWLLDGSRNIAPTSKPCHNVGYASNDDTNGSVTLQLPFVQSASLPGVTIVWSSEYGEYATKFSVVAKNGDAVVAETTISDNASNRSYVNLEIVGFDSVTVTVLEWSIPNHRIRIDSVYLGFYLLFTKKDIFSYTHEMSGCLLSGELPKSSIEFSIDNSDGRWNPNNPSGLEQYLSERQRLTVRYGMDIDGTIEWIKAGTFYLSEWATPSNGLEATFKARDMFEFLIDAGGVGAARYDTLAGLVNFAAIYLPENTQVVIDPSLNTSSASYVGATTQAESIQKCANAKMCIMRVDRNDTLHIEPLNMQQTDYVIPLNLQYAYPEIELSKPLASVAVSYKEGENPYVLPVGKGEQQTVDNDYVITEEQAVAIANWVKGMLTSRRMVTGEFRGDPRLDVFDLVQVESKYGLLPAVILTNVTYRYTGSFKTSFKGLVWEGKQ